VAELFGYKVLGDRRIPREDEADLVRWIFWRVAEGWSAEKVAAVLDNDRSCGRPWDAADVRRIVWRAEYMKGDGGLWPDGARIIGKRDFWKAQTALRKQARAEAVRRELERRRRVG
jgi:Recombinase